MKGDGRRSQERGDVPLDARNSGGTGRTLYRLVAKEVVFSAFLLVHLVKKVSKLPEEAHICCRTHEI